MSDPSRQPNMYQFTQQQINTYPLPQAMSFDKLEQPKIPKDQPAGMSRAEWIQHLRAEHQRKHRERQGHYPLDDKEEKYEKEIQNVEKVPNVLYRPPSVRTSQGVTSLVMVVLSPLPVTGYGVHHSYLFVSNLLCHVHLFPCIFTSVLF